MGSKLTREHLLRSQSTSPPCFGDKARHSSIVSTAAHVIFNNYAALVITTSRRPRGACVWDTETDHQCIVILTTGTFCVWIAGVSLDCCTEWIACLKLRKSRGVINEGKDADGYREIHSSTDGAKRLSSSVVIVSM